MSAALELRRPFSFGCFQWAVHLPDQAHPDRVPTVTVFLARSPKRQCAHCAQKLRRLALAGGFFVADERW
jgi:hypothetical protein